MPFNPLNRNLCHKYASSPQCKFFPAILPTSTSKSCSNMNYRTEMTINVSNIVQRSQQLDSRSLDVLLALARWGECRDTVRGVSIDQLSSIEEETYVVNFCLLYLSDLFFLIAFKVLCFLTTPITFAVGRNTYKTIYNNSPHCENSYLISTKP